MLQKCWYFFHRVPYGRMISYSYELYKYLCRRHAERALARDHKSRSVSSMTISAARAAVQALLVALGVLCRASPSYQAASDDTRSSGAGNRILHSNNNNNTSNAKVDHQTEKGERGDSDDEGTPSSPSCRVAVCLSGHIRSFVHPVVHRSIQRNLIEAMRNDGCQVDVFAYATAGDTVPRSPLNRHVSTRA